MSLFSPACLALLLLFVPLYQLNHTFQFVHKLLFRGLLFYLPPSDKDVFSKMKPSTSQLSTKARKRMHQQQQQAANTEHVELQVSAIDGQIYSQQGRFQQLQGFISVNAIVVVLIIFEQIWTCIKSPTMTANESSSTSDILTGASTSTVTIIIFALIYNVYMGLAHLTGAQNASIGNSPDSSGSSSSIRSSTGYWHRVVWMLGSFAFMISFMMQSTGGKGNGVGQTFIGTDVTSYNVYINQFVFNLLTSFHSQLLKTASTAFQSIDDRRWLPTLPSNSAELHIENYLPLIMMKFIISFVCASMTVSFFSGAFRYSKLFIDRLEENREALLNATATGEETLTLQGRARIIWNYALHWASFLSPLFVLSLWIPPFGYNNWMKLYGAEATDLETSYHGWRIFECTRMLIVIGCLIMRLSMVREYIQTFLLSAISLIRSLPTPVSMDVHVAVRIQALLKSLFWYTPLMAFQYLYPILVSMVLIGLVKLSNEWIPLGLSSSTLVGNVGGWGVCYATLGRGVSPFALPTEWMPIVSSSRVGSVDPVSPQPLLPLDADEFDGDLTGAVGGEDETDLSSMRPIPSVTFDPPTRGNILAAALTFLMWWSHFAWFMLTFMCFTYLRWNRTTSTKPSAVSRIETVEMTNSSVSTHTGSQSSTTQRR